MSGLILKRDPTGTYTGKLSELTDIPGRGIAIHNGETPGGLLIPQYPANSQNLIRNGNFIITQNGSSFISVPTSGNNELTVDGWHFVIGGSTSAHVALSRAFVDGLVDEAYTGVRITSFADDTNDAAFGVFTQQIADARLLNGRYVTVSFYARAISGARRLAITIRQNLLNGTTFETFIGNAEVDVDWKKFELTGFIDNPGASQSYADGHFTALWFWLTAGSNYDDRTGGVTNDNSTVDFANIQMQPGRTATPFQALSHEDEYAKVARYLEVSSDVQFLNEYATISGGGTDSNCSGYIKFDQRKNKIPDITVTASNTVTTPSINNPENKGFNVLAVSSSPTSPARLTGYTADAEIDPFLG